MLRWMVSLALAIWFVAVVSSLLAPSPATGHVSVLPNAGKTNAAQPASKNQGPAFLQQDGRPLVGFAINLHYNDDHTLYLNAIDELANLGCNAVLFSTPAFQTNGASNDIRLEVGPGRGPYRERLIELITRARQRGMTTALMPTVLLSAPRGGEWRGKIVPDSWDKWWQSYQRMTDHFVAIANEANVDIYIVGSELLTTEKQTQRWQKIISRVRKQFDGPLTYSGNFDAYADPTFWDQLDLVAMNGYFDLAGDHKSDHPPLEHVIKQWQTHRKRVLAFAASQGKPLLFTEVGYPSASWGLKNPWDYLPYDDTVSDPTVQRDGYEAFFQTWQTDLQKTNLPNSKADPKAPLAGTFFYEWDPYRSGDAKDTHYGVKGKPAFDVVKTWLSKLNARR